MIKRGFLAGAAALALSVACLAGGAQALAQETSEPQSEPTPEQMEEVMGMFAGLFQTEPLTPEQEARLPAATAVVTTMMPEGFYAQMMGDMMDQIFAPMMGMFSGETGAELVIGERIGGAAEATDALTPEEKIELATILDPAFAQRGAVLQELIGEMMTQTATAIEPAYREGLSRAYAVRFTEDQLADIAAFFATPTGALYATENMRLLADPQVMSASMQAMPAMMSQFGDMDAQMEARMAELPQENEYADLTEAQRARLSELTGIAPEELGDVIAPVRATLPATQEGEAPD